jgi:hypothetical protein
VSKNTYRPSKNSHSEPATGVQTSVKGEAYRVVADQDVDPYAGSP